MQVKIKTFLVSYFPDILIQFGILIFLIKYFENCERYLLGSGFNCSVDYISILGIMLITVGINFFVRKLINKK